MVLPPTAVPAGDTYELRVWGTETSTYQVSLYRNAALEAQVGDTAEGAALAAG